MFVAIGACESSRFDLMIQEGMVVVRKLETQLEAWETGFVVI
jgi:hypothetical protein